MTDKLLRLMKWLLPKAEQLPQLLLEFWKWILTGILGSGVLLVAAAFPAVRHYCGRAFSGLAAYSVTASIPPWLVLPLFICAVFTATVIGVQIATWIGPAYLRKFTAGEYDGIVWRWSWRWRRVQKTSMRPFCKVCGTELILASEATQFFTVGAVTSMRPDTKITCTTCNKAWGITNCPDLHELVRLKIEGDARRGSWSVTQERIPTEFK